MRHLKSVTILLAILIFTSTFLIPVESSNPPPEPDLAPVASFKEWMDRWEKANMVPAEKDVHDAYKNLKGLVGDYRDAIAGVGGNAFSSVSSVVQDKWVTMVASVYSAGESLARKIAKSESLRSSVETAASYHTTYWRNYHNLYDKHGTVTSGTVAAQIQKEIAQHGGILVSASTMMEAYWKYYYIVENYNAKVLKWNEYAPSQAKDKYWTTVPTKATFDKFACFGSCGYKHDLLEYARDTHKVDCGTAENIVDAADAYLKRNRPFYNWLDVVSRAKKILKTRTVDQGCGRTYWSCRVEDRLKHEKHNLEHHGHSHKYRNCLPHTINDHSHDSDSASTSPLSPSGGSYTASAGGTHTASLNVPAGLQYVYWYVKSPRGSGLGIQHETDYGYGSSTSASFTWNVPSGASGDYVITAYTYLSDNSVVQPSYTVTVGSSSTTPSTPSTPSTTDDDDDDTSDTDTDDDESSTASTSPYSLSASSTGSPFQAGDTITLTLSGNESYYSVNWSLESPQYTTSTNLSYDSGGYGSYESSATYTFPSAYPGDYVFKAVVYTQGNMTRYEHTHTVTLGN